MKHSNFKTLLVAVNARYIHTGLGVRSIAAYAHRETSLDISTLECTINQHDHEMLQRLYQSNADLFLFSCYIWNIALILRLTRDLRSLRPDARIGLGGPQVSYDAQTLLHAHPQIDFILMGEGEETVCQLAGRLAEGKGPDACQGIAYRRDGAVMTTGARPPLSMDALAFAYPDIDALEHRILYYESMRGCPFACSYCTSSIERGVRTRSLPLVWKDLAVFLEHRVAQVKFVDRTFNCDRARARAIWAWLAAHDNGVTNFHFELAGELLDDDTLAFLAGIRPGLFQFEIGVQSTHGETLAEVDRPADVPRLFAQVRRLLAPGNIHVHLDLIAGLPYEDIGSFQASFNAVYACRPHQLQLGFLKVLPGSKMERKASAYGLLYTHDAPYEVLATRWLNYGQLCGLHGVAAMVDTYYNSFRYAHIIAHLASLFSDPFTFYHTLWRYFSGVTEGRAVSQTGYYDLLGGFVRQQGMNITPAMQWLAKYDLLLHEKPRKIPEWLAVDRGHPYRARIQRFFMNAGHVARYLPEYAGEPSLRAERMAHLEIFPFHPETGAEGEVAVVFNYRQRTVAGLAQVHVLPVDILGT